MAAGDEEETTPQQNTSEGQNNNSGALPDTAGLLGSKPPLQLDKKAAEDVAGSLKIHIKIALEIDIQITARIKGKLAYISVVLSH
ncbi:hypothetical protein LTS08_003153 [Lithohypha guttulata]|uniref:uncharacterized protein n=1 Tax=Lithohypha guttulata TaxID=1690604 RepID=UPI002DDE4130|nr:hypothetical protein LTR51_000189 [Lithohypha guttulata]KAK5103734.1 hypothetical protein LTS08_003153 [Lithohypha guttulata]